MNEITISKKKLFTWLLVIILLAAVGFGIYAFRRFLPGREAAPQSVAAASLTTPDGDKLAQAAAVAGAQAFYSVDYQNGKAGLARPVVCGQHEYRLHHGSERLRTGLVASVGSSQNKHHGPGVGAGESARPDQPAGQRSPAGLETGMSSFLRLGRRKSSP